jgi:serine/threonine protein kinase
MLAPNTLLQDRYLVVRLLGQGGMGAVYQATDQKFGNAVALKETFYSDVNLRKAFSHEARLLNRLRHAALPVVTDYFSISDKQFLVMQYIPGKDLEQLLHERKASGQGLFMTAQVMRWADQLLDALEYLHSQKPAIIHRDIKPQNLKLTPRGEVILLDFGLAKGIVTHQSQESQSIRGYTPNYASLEQIRGTGTDARSDIYSIGATIYHLLTGEMPPDAMTRIAAILMGHRDPLKPISEYNREVPPMVASVIEKAMAPHPDQRFNSSAMMRQALRNANQNIPSVGAHRDITLTDEPMKRDAMAASAILGQPAPQPRQAPPIDNGRRGKDSRPDQVIVSVDQANMLDQAKQKLANKGQEIIGRQQPQAGRQRPQNEAAVRPKPNEKPRQQKNKVAENQEVEASAVRPFRRAVTLTGSRSKSLMYGSIATLGLLLALAVFSYTTGSFGQSITKKAPVFFTDNATLNVTGENPPPVTTRQKEMLRYYFDVSKGGPEKGRESGLNPLPEGSKFKFHFKPTKEGYFYLIAEGENDTLQTFLTGESVSPSGMAANWIGGGKDFLFPSGGQWFMLQDGAEKTPFTVVFSPKPLQGPQFLLDSAGRVLNAAEKQQFEMFKRQYTVHKANQVDTVEEGNKPVVSIMVPVDYPEADPLIFDVELKRR